MAGPFDAYLNDLKAREAANTAARLRLDPVQPDQAANGLATAKELGVPAGQVMAFPELFRDTLTQKRATTALTGAPKLSDWLRSDPVTAALAKDDLENLAWWEKTPLFAGNAVKRGTLRVGQAYNQWQAQQAAGRAEDRTRSLGDLIVDERMSDRTEFTRDYVGPGDLVRALYRYSSSRLVDIAGGDDEAAAASFQQNAAGVARQIAAIPMSPGAAAVRDGLGQIDSNGSVGEQLRQFGQVVQSDPAGFASFLAQVSAESAPQLAATALATIVTRSPAAAATFMGSSSYFTEYGSSQMEVLQESGHDLTTPDGALAAIQDEDLMRRAAERGETRGLIIGAMDGLSGGLASRALLQSAWGNLIVQGFAQAIMGGAGEAGAQLATEGKINVSDVLVEALAEFATAPVEVASMGGRAGYAEMRRALRAGKTAAALDQASAQAQASLVRQRSPEAFKAALDRSGAGDQLLYVPAQGLREFFQARDLTLDAEASAQWGIDPETFAEMEISGGRVAIPVSNFAAYLSGTDAETWIRENVTLDADEMSIADAQAFQDLVPEDAADSYERQLSDLRDADAERTSDQQVYDGFYSQLREAGRTSEVADKEARVVSAFFRSMADRTGEDSLDLAQRFGVQVRGAGDQEAQRRRGSLDIMLNDLRAGRREQVGETLTEFVVRAGGVQDVGGDVAAIEGPRGLVTETAQEVRAREAQGTMPGMMPAQGKGLPLDELGRMAVEAGYFPELMGEVQGLNDGVAADLGAALLEALRDEASGNARYLEGEGPDPGRAALNDALQERGIDPAEMSNDEIAAALEGGREFGQSAFDKGGRAAEVRRNGDRALRSVIVKDEAGAVDRQAALGRLSEAKGEYRTASGEAVTISRAARKIFSGSIPPGRLRLAGAIPELLQSAVVYNTDTPQRAYGVALAEVDGQAVIVRMVLNNDGSGTDKLYALEGFESAPVAWRDATAEVSDQEQVGATPAMGSAPTLTVADAVSQINALPSDALPLFQDRRGSIVFPASGPDGGGTIINLFESADLSTFIHEAGHYFLEAMDALSQDNSAPQAVRDDMAAVRRYLGAEDGQAFTEDQHETFARSLEGYFLEGKAPSLELADVFARVKAWLTRIYRSLSGLNVKLSPEIREVFDRMLATDAEIAQARDEMAADPLFRDKPAGMSDGDWRTYQRLARRSREKAEANLLDKAMAKVRREREAWWKAERKQLREEVEARITALPQYRMIEAMANGRILTADGEQTAPDVRISRKDLVDQFGAGVLAELSRSRFGGKRAIYAGDGVPPAVAAEMFGFAGAAEMVQILQNTRKRADAIDAETDQIMLERYGDPMTDGSIEQEALDAIHNDQQAQQNVAEARQLATFMGRDTRAMTMTLYRQRARMMLGRMNVREATASTRFLAAERRAGRDAERAFAKVARGDAGGMAAALQAKEQQILNAALYDLSREAAADVARARERMQGYGKKSVREKLEGGYIEQIDDLLDRYDFRQRGPGQVAKTERLREFMDRMIEEGREAELMIDPRMMDEARRIHYSRLSLDELRGLLDTIANLDHLGRFKQRLINGRKQRDLQETAAAVGTAIANNIGTGRIKKESRLRAVLDLVLTADSVLVDVDGGNEFGVGYESIKEDIDAGYVRVDEMNRELSEKLTELFSVYSAEDMRAMKVERHINGTRFVWSKWKAIAVALNTGNDDNMARLLAENAHPDQRMSRADLEAVLDTLDKRDWDFVQSMWDQINSYWPEIEAVTQRRTGVKPGKVEARQVDTKFGAYRGGYYPIKYDAGFGHAAAVDARTEMDRFMSAGRFAKAQTKHGHTVERKANGNGRTLNLDMDVAFAHMRDVIRDIALSEAVDNSYRVLNHGSVAQAFMEAGRKADLDMLNLWLKDVAQGPIVHSDVLNQFARIVKNNFTLSRLALNMKTVTLQATGVAQSAAVVGKKNMAHAMADYLKRPREFAAEAMEKSEFMRRRQTTFDKDINDFANDAMITSPLRGRLGQTAEILGRIGFAPMTKVQFYAVDVPTWVAGYRDGLRKFDGDEGKAISFADRMVARAQDSGAMPDRSAISRGTLSENVRQVEWVRLFTTLQGYMIAKGNRGYLTARQGARDIRAAETTAERFAATADMATNLMLLYVAETLMMGLLYAAMSAGDDDDDLTREKFATWTAGEVFGTVIGGLPLVRDGWSAFSDFGDGGGVLGSVMEIPAQVWKQAVQGENDRGLRRAVADAVGVATGFPTTAALRPIEEIAKGSDGSLIEALMGRNPLVD
ncbi:hypothetical protein [Paracoccus shanxieyensis]|uniref:Large polyvalent protein associated domain-containing protein n=1 Tax=Paracoccus shanxieyensis TaxID=2675752 RepID=A0A6L6IZS0_9RHOB|nr:hypothetical protein [Paracoccus shanxieyensis]MTH65078.1 hypothetical protein [Paracoccus shanxieyensis]MTH88222.1 hypothetical protein [Paracoccus shanxieyensis]